MPDTEKIFRRLNYFINNYVIIGIVLLGIIICGTIFFTIKKEKFLIWENIFQENAVRNTFQLRKFLEINESVTENIMFFVKARIKDDNPLNCEITENVFRNYTSNLLKTFLFIDGINWVPKITGKYRNEFEAKMRKIYSDYSINDIDADGHFYKASTREIYFPIAFVEPVESHKKLIGFDFSNDKVRGEALNQALITGKSVATKNLKFYIYNKEINGILNFTPVYSDKRSGDSVQSFDDKFLLGFVVTSYKMNEMITRIFGPAINKTMSLVIYDTSDNGPDNIIYGVENPDLPLTFNADIKIYGRNWRLKWQGSSDYAGGSQSGVAFQLAGAIAALFTLLVLTLFKTRNSLDLTEKEVETRTIELENVNEKLKQEITERIKIAEDLFFEKERLAITLADITEGVIAVNADKQITLMNKAAEIITEYKFEEVCKSDIEELLPVIMSPSKKETIFSVLEKALKTGEISKFADKISVMPKSGIEKYIEASIAAMRQNDSKIIGAIIVLRDVTERIKIDAEMQKISKFETISVIVGSIAHDFNNYLTGIVGNISFARMLIGETGKPNEILMRAEEVACQAKELTAQLLTFSKDAKPLKKHMKINEVLKHHTEFVMRGSKIECKFNIAENLWAVEADHGQITQVFSNIVLNAKQAMKDTGIIEITAENVSAGVPFLSLGPGKYVKICLKDNGPGIRQENLNKIFDPYFTTKSKGNGLGLASAFSIIKNHNGTITVESSLNKGTSFIIYLPADNQ